MNCFDYCRGSLRMYIGEQNEKDFTKRQQCYIFCIPYLSVSCTGFPEIRIQRLTVVLRFRSILYKFEATR